MRPSPETEEEIVAALARYFATPEHQYGGCPDCMEEGTVEDYVGTPSDGQRIEIHVLKRCTACGWMRAAKFEPSQCGRPPMIERDRSEE